jgi:hypothetical protein
MFHSVEHCFASVLTNHADVKELIPEFYDTEGSAGCDFLLNARNLDLGITQNGERLHDVVFPPWARSARDFIRKNRKALECDYISQKLPEWVDLIFGVKSRGKEAQRANNLFHNMAYLGPSDLRHMKTAEERAQAELQATEFGIVPDQLFSATHPQKLSLDVHVSSGTVTVLLVDGQSDVVSKDLFDEREDYLDLGDGDRDAKLAGSGDQPWEILDSPSRSMKSTEDEDLNVNGHGKEQRDRGTSIDSLSDRPWANEQTLTPSSGAISAKKTFAALSPISSRVKAAVSASNGSPYHSNVAADALQKLTFSESNNTNSSGLGSRSEESANSSTKGWLSRKLGNMGSNDVHVANATAPSNSEDSGAGGSSGPRSPFASASSSSQAATGRRGYEPSAPMSTDRSRLMPRPSNTSTSSQNNGGVRVSSVRK